MFPFSNMLFPIASQFFKNQGGFNPFQYQAQMMKNNPMMGMGFNPFFYDQQQIQESNPFSNSFFQPQRSTFGQSQPQPQQQMVQFPQQQGFNQQSLSGSLFKDANGKVDFNKIGSGVQTAFNLDNQVSPMLKMFGGFMK